MLNFQNFKSRHTHGLLYYHKLLTYHINYNVFSTVRKQQCKTKHRLFCFCSLLKRSSLVSTMDCTKSMFNLLNSGSGLCDQLTHWLVLLNYDIKIRTDILYEQIIQLDLYNYKRSSKGLLEHQLLAAVLCASGKIMKNSPQNSQVKL